MSGETIERMNVELGADVSSLLDGFDTAEKTIGRAAEQLGGALQPVGAAGEEALAPIAALSEAVTALGESSREQNAVLKTLSEQMQSIANAGEFMSGVVEGAFQGFAEHATSAAGAGSDFSRAEEEVGRGAEKAHRPVSGLMGVLREVRSEEVQAGRMSRFLVGQIADVMPVSEQAKTSMTGLGASLIQMVTAGSVFGLAMEGAKLALTHVTERINKHTEETREWAEMQQRYVLAARDAWEEFYRAQNPQSRAGSTVQSQFKLIQNDIDKLAEKRRLLQESSGGDKLWAEIDPFQESIFTQIDELTEKIEKLREQQKGLANTPEAKQARQSEDERQSAAWANERLAAEVRFQNERVRIEQETMAKLSALQQQTPVEQRGLAEYKALQDAILKAGTEQATRAEEAKALAIRQIRLRAEAVTASEERKIDIQAEQQTAAERLRIRQAQRAGNTEEVTQARAQIALIRAETEERRRALAIQREAAAYEVAARTRHQGAARATQEELQYEIQLHKVTVEKNEAERKGDEQTAAVAQQKIALLREEISTKRQLREMDARLAEETHALQMKAVWAQGVDAVNLEYKQRALEAEAELNRAFLNNDMEAYDAALRKKELLQHQHTKALVDANQEATQVLTDAMQTAFDQGIMQQRNAAEVMQQIMKQTVSRVFQMAMQEAMRRITINAAVSGSEAAKSQAGIPVVGPALAAAAMASMFAMVIGMKGSLPSASRGFDVPAGFNGLVKIHEKEMVLPAKYADNVRRGGGGATYNLSFFDARSAADAFNDRSSELNQAIRAEQRRSRGMLR